MKYVHTLESKYSYSNMFNNEQTNQIHFEDTKINIYDIQTHTINYIWGRTDKHS